ncbi:FtsK/SpoIIIE domain-containing protein [Kutzneria kofuensis]|uniref:S-DNA-T family DNA segregation ATPase FtsK/SpoIIIE n=1 Tax=Kutzneria kofuensis TaxID=103725 RepID=A0A7W9KEA5_9PSEU|nr:FtsK/SpoIIIE domain-containing protein [Kutzneria kofuensis]MBB5891013.1 S-DNA-T family DNA segregation ATPase FtsK/SpoIIIE [Kutzneria kofuensis]
MSKRNNTNVNVAGSKRSAGVEWRALRWSARHPEMVTIPTALAAGAVVAPTITASVVGGVLTGLGVHYRAHPDTFDVHVAPVLRALRRRWTQDYVGVRWRDLCDSVGLDKEHRRKGIVQYPRVVSIRCRSQHVDVVHLAPVRGQSLRTFTERGEQIAASLRVERVAFEPLQRGRIAMIVQRSMPFTETIPAPEMPQDSREVDPARLYVGEDEFGQPVYLSLVGKQSFLLIGGATGSGKNSWVFAPLRSLAPMIRDGLVKLWVIDPKKLEFKQLVPMLGGRYADGTKDEDTGDTDIPPLMERYIADMEDTQMRMSRMGVREAPISKEFPLNLMIVDEVASLTAFTTSLEAGHINAFISKVVSMGRTTHHAMIITSVDPNKDVLPFRDLIPNKICLRVNSATQPDMLLGEGARENGAIADQIPATEEFDGVGYLKQETKKSARMVRAAYTSSTDVHELVEFVTGRPHPDRRLRAA